jgi:hypothetical protein
MMADEKPKNEPDKPGEGIDRPQDPIVDRLKRDPSQPVAPSLTLVGFFGESDRPGYRRLYFTRMLDNFAEFRAEDVLHITTIPPEQPPFIGEQATRVSIRRDATVHYTRTRTPRPLDEFDLDVRLRARPMRRPRQRVANDETQVTCGETPPCGTECQYHTCEACPGNTQVTCGETPPCGTGCYFATCETCYQTQCAQLPTCDGGVTCGFCTQPTEENPSVIETACQTCGADHGCPGGLG